MKVNLDFDTKIEKFQNDFQELVSSNKISQRRQPKNVELKMSKKKIRIWPVVQKKATNAMLTL